ncbi:hypothetical protein IAT38_000939 [Cryptococcus sp. DSM 104549]
MTFAQQLLEALPRPPPKSQRGKVENPIKIIRSLSWLQLAFFGCGWLAWVCDAIDFFAVTLATARLATYYAKPVGTITLSITLTLLFRPLGALIFGLLSDRYGRKWPLAANLIIIAAISLASAFCTTFSAFLAVRSLFGIGMGGIWGSAIALSLENMPVEARGLFSGFLQLGYSCGYLIIAAVNLNPYVAGTSHSHWRVLFYVAAGFSTFAACVRLVLPESPYFVERKEARREAIANGEMDEGDGRSKTTRFLVEVGKMIKVHWIRCIYGVVFMAAFNFYSHGSQDLFPTYIQKDKGLSAHDATIITIIGNCGAVAGCMVGGWASQYLGRRLTIIAFCLFCCAMLPLWLLPNNFSGLAAGAFFVQAGVQGAYGVVPIYLSEISPTAFRAMWPGVCYQLGNMASSASAQIEAVGGERMKDPATGLPAYGKVSAILIGVAAGVLVVCCIFGTEQHGAHFEKGRAAFEKDAGLDKVDDDVDRNNPTGKRAPSPMDDDEKGDATHVERV